MMNLIISAVLIFITYFVLKNSYRPRRDKETRFTFPRWVVILYTISLCIPVIGLIFFLLGIISYITTYINEEVVFRPKGKILNNIINYLNQEI